jgi:quinoprotein glucose dehydrogenase
MRLQRTTWAVSTFIVVVSAIVTITSAADPEPPKKLDYNPTVHKDNGDGEKAIRRFQFDKSLKVDLWASEPLLANPVAFCFDEKGRCYVAETFRHSAGVTDNRSHMNWLDDELASRTVEERVEMYKKYSKGRFEQTYEKERDRVRLIEDSTGSGKADKASVFSDDFGKAADGIGSGLLARKGNVYYTCIPDLWILKDKKGTGTADVKQSLATGFGVHVAFIGHDLHGLRMGPDGRLYFTIGDRGLNVKTKEGKHLYNPDSGAVLRCDPDGSNMEIVHVGLRNPQELAFDDYGNLFTVDNNSDSGDRARFVYVVEGGDSGWRIGYQYGSEMGNRGPWNYEKLWHPQHEGQPAYIVPPLVNFSDGPSGFCHYPGVGLGDKYKGHFFLCDFRGTSGNSGIWSFTVKPKGASFEMVNPKHFVWSTLATDCDFGPDCNFYVSDWTEGWNKPGRGRIYKVSDAEEQKKPIVAEVKKLLAEGFDKLSVEQLSKLLEHAHQQVRMEAQFALAAKGFEAIEPFAKVVKESKNQLARLHAIWGLGQIVRNDTRAAAPLASIINDADPEVRAQTAKVLGPGRAGVATKALVEALKDAEPRVQFFAMQSIALPARSESENEIREIHRDAAHLVVRIAAANQDKDPYLRHAASRALAMVGRHYVGNPPPYFPDPSVHMAVLLGYRQATFASQNPTGTSFGELWDVFLQSSVAVQVNEAARAIHDAGMVNDFARLAALTTKPNIPVPALYRALNAHFRIGNRANADALATFAARSDVPSNLRVLALKMLGDWGRPPRRDYITGLTQNLGARDASVAVDALKARIGGIFSGPADVQKQAITVAGKLGIKQVGPTLLTLVVDNKIAAGTRVEALSALQALKDPLLSEGVEKAIASTDPNLRNAGRSILAITKPDDVLRQLKEVLAGTDVIEKQGALAILSEIKSPDSDEQVEAWLDKLINKQAPAELHLDILEAATKRDSVRIKRRLSGYEEARPKGDDLAAWRETLQGGDAARGRNIFLNHAAASCQKCHKLDGEGGEVGPPVNGVAGKQKRDYLLEALVLPSKQITKGYDSVLLTLANGKPVTGVLKAEDNKSIKVMTAEGQLLTINKEDIDERRTGKSAMPDDLAQKLTKREIRDLIEFLSGLKEEWKK